jgi:hypothetical protein
MGDRDVHVGLVVVLLHVVFHGQFSGPVHVSNLGDFDALGKMLEFEVGFEVGWSE